MNDLPDGKGKDSISKFDAIIKNRCPSCYQGVLYQKYLMPYQHCQHCAFKISGLITGDGPAVLVMFLSTSLSAIITLFAYFILGLSTLSVMAIWIIFVIGFSLLILPWLKTVMIFLEYSKDKDETD